MTTNLYVRLQHCNKKNHVIFPSHIYPFNVPNRPTFRTNATRNILNIWATYTEHITRSEARAAMASMYSFQPSGSPPLVVWWTTPLLFTRNQKWQPGYLAIVTLLPPPWSRSAQGHPQGSHPSGSGPLLMAAVLHHASPLLLWQTRRFRYVCRSSSSSTHAGGVCIEALDLICSCDDS